MANSFETPVRLEGVIKDKDVDVYDSNNVLRFRVNMQYRKSSFADDAELVALTIKGNDGVVDIFKYMKKQKDVKVYLSDEMPPLHAVHKGETRITAPWPITPIRILILLHELSHMQQYMEWDGLGDIKVNAGISKSLTVLSALKAHGLDVVDADILIDELLLIHDDLFKIATMTGEDHADRLRATTTKYEILREKYPVISKLMELHEPLIEQDAHSRTNVALDEIGSKIGTDMDFVASNEPYFSAQSNKQQNPSSDAYNILRSRKLHALQPSGSTIMAMCENLGIQIVDHTKGDPAYDVFNDEALQDSLKRVWSKIGKNHF